MLEIKNLVVNYGVIDGQVRVTAGPYARFENSGWMGITAAGAGVTAVSTACCCAAGAAVATACGATAGCADHAGAIFILRN